MVSGKHVVVIGAGISGLVAALCLAQRGFRVTLLERSAAPGGKMRVELVAGRPIDAGPTVLTMRWVFEQIFREAGTELDAHIRLQPLATLARHAWPDGTRLDLFADGERTIEAIGDFAGAAEAKAYAKFCARARSVYEALEAPFMRSSQPTPISLTLGAGLTGLPGLLKISPFATLWNALGEHFKDYRLRQLFARYATYCGASPFLAPATLMLIAHVESRGVWTVDGGMHALARAIADLAAARGVTIRYDSEASEILISGGRTSGVRVQSGEVIAASEVIASTDAAAFPENLFGRTVAAAVPPRRKSDRSLSAVTWMKVAATSGFDLSHHNVFFSRDYEGEFREIFCNQSLPTDPTVYICAQDRNGGAAAPRTDERLFVLVNAPASGDAGRPDASEIAACERRVMAKLLACGLTIETSAQTMAAPPEFATRFPATGGALYGQATHGWASSFSRPHARTKLPGLYLAGGSVHPGPGVPMAAISGWLAAASLVSDLDSPTRSRPVAMPGGMSTR